MQIILVAPELTGSSHTIRWRWRDMATLQNSDIESKE